MVDVFIFCEWSNREAQEFIEKFEGALGKGKGRKLYAFKVMMTKVMCSFCNSKDPYMMQALLSYNVHGIGEMSIFKLSPIQKLIKFNRDFENFKTACIPWERKIKEVESWYHFNITSVKIDTDKQQ